MENSDYLVTAEFLQTGPYIATLSAHGAFSLWEIKTGQLLTTTRLLYSQVFADFIFFVAISTDGRFVVADIDAKQLYIWESSSGELVGVCEDNVPSRSSGSSRSPEIKFTSDGKGVVSCTDDDMRFWDITALYSPSLSRLCDRAEELRIHFALSVTRQPGNNEAIRAVSYDGQLVVSTTENRVWIWDARTSQKYLMLQGHKVSESGMCLRALIVCADLMQNSVLSGLEPQGDLLATISSSVESAHASTPNFKEGKLC